MPKEVEEALNRLLNEDYTLVCKNREDRYSINGLEYFNLNRHTPESDLKIIKRYLE